MCACMKSTILTNNKAVIIGGFLKQNTIKHGLFPITKLNSLLLTRLETRPF